jgi:hypothetical protein
MKLTTDEEITAEKEERLSYTPRTTLGEKLFAIRERIVAGGAHLLSWQGIEKEVAARRGATDSNNAHHKPPARSKSHRDS